jgi:hypothetical protein
MYRLLSLRVDQNFLAALFGFGEVTLGHDLRFGPLGGRFSLVRLPDDLLVLLNTELHIADIPGEVTDHRVSF